MKPAPLWMHAFILAVSAAIILAIAGRALGAETPGAALDAALAEQTARIEALAAETREMRAEIAGHETRLDGAESGLAERAAIDAAIGLQIIDLTTSIDNLAARLRALEEEAGTIPPVQPGPVTPPPAGPGAAFLAPSEPVADGKPILLLGLDGWGDGIEEPFINLARKMGNVWSASQKWPGADTMGMAELWRGGFIDPETMLPRAIPPGFDFVRTGLLRGGARYDREGYAGTYVVEWEGEAGNPIVDLSCQGSEKYPAPNRMEFTCPATSKDWNNVKFPGLANGGLKALRIFRKEDESQVRAGAEFSPRFLDYAHGYKVLRTMDIQASVVAGARSVDQLARKSHSQWAADPRINYDGLPMGPPIEALFDMAVAADSALWMNVSGPLGAPAVFDEIAVGGTRHRENYEQKLNQKWSKQYAPEILGSPEWDKYADEIVRSLIASGYPQDRALYVETANEVWNNANPFWWNRDYFLGIYDWLAEKKPANGYSTMVGVGYMEARFAVALEKALLKAKRKQAVVFVLAAQHANPATSEGALIGFRRYFEDAGLDPAPWMARAGLSTATYFHEGTSRQGLFPAASDDELKAKWLSAIKSDPQGTAKALTDWYLNVDQQASIPYLVRMRKLQEAMAAKYGVRFIGDYEGLTHDTANVLRDDPAFADWYWKEWMDGPEGERLVRAWLDALYAENANAIIANYKGVCPREIKYPWCDGVYGQDVGVRRALSGYLRN